MRKSWNCSFTFLLTLFISWIIQHKLFSSIVLPSWQWNIQIYIHSGTPLLGNPFVGTRYIVSWDAEVCGAERESSRMIRDVYTERSVLRCCSASGAARGWNFSYTLVLPAASLSRLPPRLTAEYKRMYNVCVVFSSFLCVPQTPNGRDFKNERNKKKKEINEYYTDTQH